MTSTTTTAESQRMKALAGLLTNDEDLYDDDLFFSGSVKQKQQVIVKKLSKNAPIKDNRGVTMAPNSVQHQQNQQVSSQSKQSVVDNTVSQNNHNDENENDQDDVVQFGESSNQSTFVSASVRERAAAMSGFLTKKKEGLTSGQARAMEWRGGGNSSSAANSNNNTSNAADCCALPNKIAPNFVSQFDRAGENDTNRGSTPTGYNIKKKSKPSFLFQWDDSPRANDSVGVGGDGTPRGTPSRTPLTPRTPSRGGLVAANNDSSGDNNLLSPRTPRQSTTPRGRHHSNMLSSPRASSTTTKVNHSQAEAVVAPAAAAAATAAVNSSMAVEAGSISADIDDWLGGMSLSDSEEGDDDDNNNNNGDDEFFMNDLDKVLSEANGFLENVVESKSDEEEEEEEVNGVHFGFDDQDDNVGMSDELDTELESARQLAEGFTRFLDQDSMSPEVVSDHGSSSDDPELESARQLAEGFTKLIACDDEGSMSPDFVEEEEEVAEEEKEEVEEVNHAWVRGKEEVVVVEEEEDEEEYVVSARKDQIHEDKVAEEESAEENDGDWEGWTRNNDFFADFDEKDEAEDASQTAESVLSQEEIAPTPMESHMPRSETTSDKPKLKIQIKGAPEFKPAKKEAEEGVFFYASQLSPLAGDDEQLLDTQPAIPSPVSVEPVFSKPGTSSKKFDTTPKKFGFKKKIVHRTRPEIDDDESVEEPQEEEEFLQFQAHFGMTVSSTTNSDETEMKSAKTPPKLNIYIKGAPQFSQPQPDEEEDAFYFKQPSPLFGDDKGLLSSNFSSSPTMFEQKKEKSLTSSTKKHFKNFVSKTLPAKGSSKYDQESINDAFSNQSGPECFNNDIFFAAPASPVRQEKVVKEGGSTKKKILGLLSGKKKKQSRGLYLLDD